MKYAEFNAVCPFEIGDEVMVQGKGAAIITDILCIHSIKTGLVEFRYEFNESGKYFIFNKLADETEE